MKNLLGLAVLMIITFCSCSNDRIDDLSSEITEADIFVASEDFQSYQTLSKNCSRQVFKILKGLSRSERLEFDDLVKKAKKTEDYKELMELEKKIGQILGIDYSAMLADLYEARQQLFNGSEFTGESLLKALQKYNKLHKSVPLTRSEYEMTEMDCQEEALHEYESIYASCMNEYNAQYYYEIGFVNNYTTPDERITARRIYEEIARSCNDRAALKQAEAYIICMSSLN